MAVRHIQAAVVAQRFNTKQLLVIFEDTLKTRAQTVWLLLACFFFFLFSYALAAFLNTEFHAYYLLFVI